MNIQGWGSNYDPQTGEIWYGQATPPAGNDYVEIDAGGFHGLGLKFDGSVVGWGLNYDGQCSDIPGGATLHTILVGENWCEYWYGNSNDYVAVTAGEYHSCALKSDGSVVCWGRNVIGECNAPDGNDFVAIAAGEGHSHALKSDGSIIGWGANGWGECNFPDGNDFVAITSGKYHSLALKNDHSIVCWGYNYYGQCSNIPGGATLIGWYWHSDTNDFEAIAAGGYHSCALKSDGSIICWGESSKGQTITPPGNDYVEIAAGGYHNIAIKSNGSIFCWGYIQEQATPPIGNNFVVVSGGYIHSLALKRYLYNVKWNTIDGGGGQSKGGSYVLTGTIGQPDAANSAGGDYELLGGFWPGGPLCIVDFVHFARFAEYWLETGVGLPADLYEDNVVDLLDLELFVYEWLYYCPHDWPLK